jgi:ComF family protein
VARELVHELKYRGRRHLAAVMADLAAPLLPAECNAVVCVPLHAERERLRGFNQSHLLAVELARRAERPYLPNALARNRDTPSQTGLSPDDRVANVRGAFVGTDALAGQRLALVDDVCTTGATLYACARALRRAGAGDVVAVVFTRAI